MPLVTCAPTIISCLSQNTKENSKAILVSTSTKAAHTFKHGIEPSIEHIDRSTISAMRKLVNILFVLVHPYSKYCACNMHVPCKKIEETCILLFACPD